MATPISSGNSELQLQIDKISRLFANLQSNSLTDLSVILNKVVTAIINTPNEDRYRSLKLSNDTIKRRILARSGGVEFLKVMGFTEVTKSSGEKHLELEWDKQGKDIDTLKLGKDWLVSTCDAYKTFHTNAGREDDELLAECTIQLRMPTGQTITGGFMQSDSLAQVHKFAQSYFVKARRQAVRLSQPGNSAFDACSTASLGSLGLGSRIKLTVISQDEAQTDSIFSAAARRALVAGNSDVYGDTQVSSHQAMPASVAATAAAAEKRKREQRREQEAREEERQRALSAFQEDREAFGGGAV